MQKILFICSGNVGRSQMAEAFFNFLDADHRAISAGIDPLTPTKYPSLPIEVIQVMEEKGIDVSKNVVKYIQPKMLENVDRIIVMCDKQKCPTYIQSSKKVIYWDIADPYGLSLESFRKIRDQIQDKVLAIFK